MTGSPRRLGADLDDLQHLSATFDRAARTLTDAVGRIDRALAGTGWHGSGAGAFARRWASDRAAVRAATHRCAAAATELRQQLEQQRTAAQTTGHGRTPPALTRSESVLRVGGFVDVGPLEGRVGVQARVEELDGIRSRVTVSDVVGLAGVAAAGANVEGGCGTATATPVHPLRAEAEVAAGAEVEHRTIWEVPDDDVHELLAVEGAQRVAVSLGLGPLAAAVAQRFEPEPAGHEVLLRATASAGAVSPRPGALGPVLSAHAVTSLAVGLATANGGRTSLVLEASGEAAGTFQPGFLSALGLRARRSGTSSWMRVEIPHERVAEGGQPVRFELRSTSPSGTVDRVVVHAHLSDDAAVRAATAQMHRDVSAGRPPSRAIVDAVLAGVEGSAVHPVVQSDQLEAVSQGCSARSVGGAGVTLGGGGGAQVVNLRHRH